ncbi:hypothetical protein CY652_12235 [Burkholderia sp. WAC0059]|uniref:MmgE/PrpD family protein n=1 Tax=Burkholderia sp. WAC0059 TaxID=2066022 RepID=UPI000C7F661F|nr:MmgE/PrpD family protein [Burkholderia sp. WAC0059]PLZ02136.1 hypothetical protein CY652_12235 [Burkholderia sp. WAC0059]
MHNATAQSAVSDALVAFAAAPRDGLDPAAVEVACRALAAAREQVRTADDSAQPARALAALGSDLRARAWRLGVRLASRAPASRAVPVLAVVLAYGEVNGKAHGTADDDLAAAAAIGIEAAARVAAAVEDDAFRARWNVASALGGLGAVLALARLLRLDATRARHALGIVATQAAGLAHNAGSPIAALETGKAAADAVEAALLAKHGFTSAPASIDGRRGLAALMAYRFDESALVGALGCEGIGAN